VCLAIHMMQGRLHELVDVVAQLVTDNPGHLVLRSTLVTTLCEVDRDDEARRLLQAEAEVPSTPAQLRVATRDDPLGECLRAPAR